MSRSNYNSRRVRQRRRVVMQLHQNGDAVAERPEHSADIVESRQPPMRAALPAVSTNVESGVTDQASLEANEAYWNSHPVRGKILGKLQGRDDRFVHRLTDEPIVVVGSGKHCDWSFPGSGLAEQQACFLFFDHRIYCVDLTGTYAVQVRGGRFQQIWIHDGSLVEIGPLRLKLNLEARPTDHVDEETTAAGSHDDDARDKEESSEDRSESKSSRRLELRKKGNLVPWNYELKREVTLIGRDAPSTIRLKDPSLSVVSSAIVMTDAGVWGVRLQNFPANEIHGTHPRCRRWKQGESMRHGIFQLCLPGDAETTDEIAPTLVGHRDLHD